MSTACVGFVRCGISAHALEHGDRHNRYTAQQIAQRRPLLVAKHELQVPHSELLAQVSVGNWQAKPL